MSDHPPLWRTRPARGVVSLAVIVAVFGFLLPRLASYGAVTDTVATMTVLELATLGAVAAWNLVSYWPMQLAAQPGLRWREAAVANLASTAVANTIPGGAALGIGVTVTMQRSWGIPVSTTTLAMVVAGVWNNFVKLGLPVVALALLALDGDAGTALVVAASIGVVVLAAAIGAFAVMLHGDGTARLVGVAAGRLVDALGRVLHRSPTVEWGDRAVGFRAQVVGLVRRRWSWITLTALVSHCSLFAVLLVALRTVGVSGSDVSWQSAFAAFAFVRLLSAVPITPGGLGLVELGLTAAIGAGLPGQSRNQVAAAVLLFRGLTWLLPVPLGLGCWAFWRTNRSWRHRSDERSGAAGTAPAVPAPVR